MNDVPTIAIGDPTGPATREALDEACRTWGFFQILDHGLDPARMGEMLAAMARFFGRPAEAKRVLERTDANPWGYYDRELTKNARDWKEIFDVGPEHGAERPQWPGDDPAFREACEAFAAACHEIGRRLVAGLARNLGAAPESLLAAFDPHTSFLRLNHYPTCADPAAPDAPTVPASGELGIHHHTDAGALTVLLQDDQPGLQVERDGRWHTVAPRAGALVVNIGDIVQVWSNDRYRAPLHRVVVSAERDRYSAAYFLNPSYATDYAPLPGACDGGAPRYRAINWGEFRRGRAAGDYADHGEEIQISQFAIPAPA